ncbi:efflux RND transporter periplasmic adaptor subunit [Spirosoma arboris]|uniref:efflux RND transporter periplasmic adaptor subunit n=1 Tax=Spirosoma arboris TaxID=2682092 RepID=UPI0018DB4D87|nr:efflux RND transporter periplasmic adaptor subunit [Spirosoma arboris]
MVITQPARLGAFVLKSVATGVLRAPDQSKLSFRISGTINQIDARNGEAIAAGQMLARLDDRDQQLALRIAQDQVAEVKVQLRALIAEYGGHETDTASLKPNARTFVLTKSGYYRAQTTLAAARQQLEYTVLRAPYAGLVANLSAKPYNFITSFEPFCTLLSQAGLLVEFSVLESELGGVQNGQSVRIIPFSLPNQSYIGIVSEINPYVNGQGLVLVKAKINHPNDRLFEGMNARVFIERRLAKQVIIPRSAVVERSGRKVVFTVEKGLAKWHYVTIAHENDTEVAIAAGLKSNEQVIVVGSLNLAHDSPVTAQKQ